MSWKETIPLQILKGLKRLISPYKGKDPSSVLKSGLITHGDTDAPTLSISKVLEDFSQRLGDEQGILLQAQHKCKAQE